MKVLPNGSTDWYHIIRTDMRTLNETSWIGIDKNQRLLNRQTDFDKEDPLRNMAPYARRIDRFVREVGFLGVPPWLDVEFGDKAGFDNSLALEAFHEQLGSRIGVSKKIAQAHRICVYAPLSFLKTAMPRTVAWQRGFDDVAPVSADPAMDAVNPDAGGAVRLDEVPPDAIPEVDINDVAQITPEVRASAKINDMPSLSNMTTPRCEVIDPRHVITDPYIGGLDEAYYIAHLVLRTPSQIEAIYGKPATGFKGRQVKTRDDGIKVNGINMTSFRPMTNQEICVLCEVYIRQDPSKVEDTGMFGVLDFDTGEWIVEPKKMFLPNRWTVVRADETHPKMWQAPSYIDMAYDDMEDRAWIRTAVRDHAGWSATDALWLNDQVTLDSETEEEIASGTFSRRIVKYKGPRFDPTVSHTRPFPTALVQLDQLADQSFSRNTGATGTSQGHGQSNKVATAFNQEMSFMAKREAEIMNKLYDAYIEVMLIATWLVMNYGSSQFVVSQNGFSFTMDRDMVKGVANYTISAVNRSAQDPLAARLMMVQQLEKLFSNPELLQYFDKEQVAKLIAALNGWPSRVIAAGGPDQAAQMPPDGAMGGESPTKSGTSHSLGSGVDSAESNPDTVGAAVAGATNRNT